MTIRARLFILLIPTFAAFFLLTFLLYYFNSFREWLIFDSCITVLIIVGTVFLITQLITKPIKHLNQAAMKIAAGDYETHLIGEGPREIVELSNTFNTMSECLVENISRLKESSRMRERMYGEYECALLLQEYMLEKPIEHFSHPNLRLKLITSPSATLQKGLFLKIESPQKITLIEAIQEGFSGLFELNQCMHQTIPKLEAHPYIQIEFDVNFTHLSYLARHFAPPLIWSLEDQSFMQPHDKIMNLRGPMLIFLIQNNLNHPCITMEELENWLSRTLSHFAKDGLNIVTQMITKELGFLANKHKNVNALKMIALELSK